MIDITPFEEYPEIILAMEELNAKLNNELRRFIFNWYIDTEPELLEFAKQLLFIIFINLRAIISMKVSIKRGYPQKHTENLLSRAMDVVVEYYAFLEEEKNIQSLPKTPPFYY